MKSSACIATSVFFGLLGPLIAQNFATDGALLGDVRNGAATPSVGPLTLREIPPTIKARAAAPEVPAVYSALGTNDLEPFPTEDPTAASSVDLSVLQQPSPFRNVAAGHQANTTEAETNEVKRELALISATYRVSGKRETNCQNIALSIEQRIKFDHSNALEIVEAELKSNPSCACEVVKSAIKATDAETELVVAILETVVSAAPQAMMIAAQCAIAAAPESLAGVQALLSKYEANAGDRSYSSKSAKGAKVASAVMPDNVAFMPNPLDFPGFGPVGSGVQPGFEPLLPILTRPVTQVGP